MVTTTNRLSLTWIVVILSSPFVVPILAQDNKQLLEAWVTKCFIEGFNAANSSTVNCSSVETNPELHEVPELTKQCDGYFELGCLLGLKSLFCSVGVSRVLSNDPANGEYACNDIVIAKDNASVAFGCCITCKDGWVDGELNNRCPSFNKAEIQEIARDKCCKAAITKNSNLLLSNVTTVKPISLHSSDNVTFDDISSVMRENELKINDSLSKNSKINGVTPSMILDSSNSSTDESVTTVSIVSTTTVVSSASTSQPSSSISDSSTNSLPTSTDPSTSPPTSSPSPEASSTESPSVEASSSSTISRKVCTNGDSCEDINECDEVKGICGENEKCFSLKGSSKCCPIGTEVRDGESECTYIDYCARDPCFQSEDDQHYCVNYFIGRLCKDKLVEGYKFVKGSEGIMERLENQSSDDPRYLELTQKEINLDKGSFERLGLINLKLPNRTGCEWEFEFDAYAPLEGDKLKENQLKHESGDNFYKVWVSGPLKPQSVVISITCAKNFGPFYRNTIYFTFTPRSRTFRKDSV